jgi:hypothetical protein
MKADGVMMQVRESVEHTQVGLPNAMQISCGGLPKPPRPRLPMIPRGGRGAQAPGSCICGLGSSACTARRPIKPVTGRWNRCTAESIPVRSPSEAPLT